MSRSNRALQSVPASGATVTWRQSGDQFLRRDLARGSRRIYSLTLARLAEQVGGDTPLAEIDPQRLAQALSDAYPHAAPASWNRQVATVRSLAAFAHRQGWVPEDWARLLERRREQTDHSKALNPRDLDRLLADKTIPVRERCLWSMLLDTAARANEILALNVEDVDLAQRRAVIRSKGGDIDVVHYCTGTARLLPKIINGRQQGPVFLAERAPAPSRAPAIRDVDPVTGRARLSYRRSAELFKQASGGAGLHQLRHSSLTQLAEAGVPTVLLAAKSRHASLRTLQRYARPSVEAVARLTAEHDPLRRR